MDNGPARWAQVLALGCQATAWWLRRQKGPFALLAALGVGLAASMAACAGGRLALLGPGIAGPTLALAALADALCAGVGLP